MALINSNDVELVVDFYVFMLLPAIEAFLSFQVIYYTYRS